MIKEYNKNIVKCPNCKNYLELYKRKGVWR